MAALIPDAAAAILAGGQGTRLGGVSKALIPVGGRAILARQLEVLRPLFEQILVVAPDPAPFQAFGVRVARDRFPGRGPSAGVHAALDETSQKWVFCIACDMPFVSAEPIRLLASRRSGADAVAPVRGGALEPLFAFYASHLKEPLARALAADSPSLARLLDGFRTTRVGEDELAAVDEGCRSLANVNTPDELAQARSAAAGCRLEKEGSTS